MIDKVAATLRAPGCVFAEDEARLLVSAAKGAKLARLIERRVGGEPLEHLLGWVDFRGVRLAVAPGVFVPRRRTELLASQALAVVRPGDVVFDMCCGAGAIGATLPADVELHAVDIDAAAVRCARANLPHATVYQGDLYEPLPPKLKADLIVANAPYVPTEAIALMPPEARLHEPRTALDGGPDGLDVQRRVIAGAADRLRPGGHLLVETSADQRLLTAREFRGHGFKPRIVYAQRWDATLVIGAR